MQPDGSPEDGNVPADPLAPNVNVAQPGGGLNDGDVQGTRDGGRKFGGHEAPDVDITDHPTRRVTFSAIVATLALMMSLANFYWEHLRPADLRFSAGRGLLGYACENGDSAGQMAARIPVAVWNAGAEITAITIVGVILRLQNSSEELDYYATPKYAEHANGETFFEAVSAEPETNVLKEGEHVVVWSSFRSNRNNRVDLGFFRPGDYALSLRYLKDNSPRITEIATFVLNEEEVKQVNTCKGAAHVDFGKK